MGPMRQSPPVLHAFSTRLAELGWVSDLLVAGSVATGDYRPGVSDLDLVAIVDGPVDTARTAALAALHREIDEGVGRGLSLGCVYVDHRRRHQVHVEHPTWTHGLLVSRILSGVSRAELVRHGYAAFGRPPTALLPAMTDDEVRAAVRDEVTGYWAWAARRPWLWLNPVIADLGLTAMARARYAVATGKLLGKTDALDRVAAPAWLVDQLKARRDGTAVTSPRVRTGLIAWLDAVRTVVRLRR
jgi:Nucleotidyltransferase domain